MTRQKKEIIRRINDINREIDIDRQLSFGIIPDGAHDRLYQEISHLENQLAILRHYSSYEEMMYDCRGIPDSDEDLLPFGEMHNTQMHKHISDGKAQMSDLRKGWTAKERLMERLAKHMEQSGNVLSVDEKSNEMTGIQVVNVECQKRHYEIVRVDGMTCLINRKESESGCRETQKRNPPRATGHPQR